MPKPTIVDYNTIFNANIIQPLCDLAWDVFGSETEDSPVATVDEAREKLKAVAQAGDTMTGPLTLPASDPTLNNHATRKAYVDAQIDEQYDNKIAATLEAIYPIGTIYFCAASTDPNSALPGVWTLLIPGYFLVSAGGTGDYVLGTVGGEERVTLTEAQLPSHQHGYYSLRTSATTLYGLSGGGLSFNPEGFNSLPAGSNQSHENRPPYLAVNMWQRTA